MTTMLSNHLDMFARRFFPVLAGIVFVLISTVPYYIPGFGPVAPNVVLIAVFFWVIHHAEFVPTATVFFIGLLLDILSGAPPGINAAALVLVRTMLVMQSKVFRGKSFLLLWWGFSLVAFLVGLVIWALSTFYHMILLNPLPIIFQMLMTITIFPFFSWVFAKLHQKFLPID